MAPPPAPTLTEGVTTPFPRQNFGPSGSEWHWGKVSESKCEWHAAKCGACFAQGAAGAVHSGPRGRGGKRGAGSSEGPEEPVSLSMVLNLQVPLLLLMLVTPDPTRQEFPGWWRRRESGRTGRRLGRGGGSSPAMRDWGGREVAFPAYRCCPKRFFSLGVEGKCGIWDHHMLLRVERSVCFHPSLRLGLGSGHTGSSF